MEPRPNFLLCFLATASIGVAFGLAWYGYFGSKMVVGFIPFTQAFIQPFLHLRYQKKRWEDRKTATPNPPHGTSWPILLLIGLAVLVIAEIAQRFGVSPSHATLFFLGMILLPLSFLLSNWLNEIGIERPLREWHKLSQQRAASPTPTVTPTATPATQVQRLGKP